MDPERALDGIRVIDLTQVMAGPYCCMLLGDMGADVIKVEPPGGEASRDVAFELAPGVSGPFLAVNRNKRGITLDLKQPEAVAVLARLVATADVLVENYRPGVAHAARHRLRDARRASIRGSSTAPSRASGRRGPTRTAAATTSSRRA